MKPWFLLFDLNGFTHELIYTQKNDVLLLTWGQTVSQKVFNIGLKFLKPELLV